ncbi:hypothetical protein ON010_g6402 [Phytophthora cinnamomi]|nr:hypothetical protein ON010_g6402 [Phytophthora cinnamomi]
MGTKEFGEGTFWLLVDTPPMLLWITVLGLFLVTLEYWGTNLRRSKKTSIDPSLRILFSFEVMKATAEKVIVEAAAGPIRRIAWSAAKLVVSLAQDESPRRKLVVIESIDNSYATVTPACLSSSKIVNPILNLHSRAHMVWHFENFQRRQRPGTPVGQNGIMSRPALKPKDDKERYLTYSIVVRAADKEQGIEEEVAAFSDDDVRVDEEYTAAIRKASVVVLPVDYNEKLQEDLWEIRKPRDESLAEYCKRFRALARQANTFARLMETSPMCEDALCRLYKRGLPYDWQNQYDASGQVYITVAALVPFFDRIEQGERPSTVLEIAITTGVATTTTTVSSINVEDIVAADKATTTEAITGIATSTAQAATCNVLSIVQPRTTHRTAARFAQTTAKKKTTKLTSSVDLVLLETDTKTNKPGLSNAAKNSVTQVTKSTLPRSQEGAAYDEIQHLLKIDAIEQIYDSEAHATAFFLTKARGALRLLVDFRALNKYLQRSPYYVPKIREILIRLSKAKCMSTLDANMGYFARCLAKELRAVTAFCLPFGKFQFKRLPMGISTAPDEYQASMERILGDLPFVVVHPGPDQESGGDTADRGAAHRLNRLTSKNVPFTWTPEDSTDFHAVKSALAHNVWLAFLDYHRRFHVFADANGRQIGGVIVQGKRILACFSRAMTETQRRYTTMEWELLSIVEILKEYRTMLLGFPVVLHTDHKNLLYPRENSLRVKRWKLLREEYRLTVEYVPGAQNVGADAFSRLQYDHVKRVTEDELCAIEEEEQLIDGAIMKKHQLEDPTCNSIIERLEHNSADPDYALRPALRTVLLHYRKRVMVPDSLRQDLIEFYHDNLLQPSGEKQFRTMATFWWPNMEKDVNAFVKKCIACKRAKLHGGKQNYGRIPPTPATNNDRPFDVVHVDLVWPIEDEPYCLTAIELFRWLKVIMQQGKTSKTIAISFERAWLCRYPRPKPDLQDQLAVVLDCAAYVIRVSYHPVLRASPAQLLSGEDMITRELHFANWGFLSKQRFMAILQENERENMKRIQHFYHIGDQVMLRIPARSRKKTDPVSKGPFIIKEVFDNGTVRLDTGSTEYRVNIRRIFPC